MSSHSESSCREVDGHESTPSPLQMRLQEVAGKHNLTASVAYSAQGETTFASAKPADHGQFDFSENSAVGSGCISKALTATLVAQAVTENRLRFDQDIGEILGLSALDGIKIRHLLNHTHGLDDTSLNEAPVGANGRMDIHGLCRTVLQRPRFGVPGATFNYGNLGAWFVAAALENVFNTTFAELIDSRLGGCLGVRIGDKASHVMPVRICPAIGGDLRLSARALLRFTQEHLILECADDRSFANAYAQLRSDRFEPPGWHPKFSGICLGWNEFGDNWYGHGAKINGESAIVRFNPVRQIAFAITGTTEEAASIAMTLLFGNLLPEFNGARSIRYLSADAWLHTDPTPFIGTYANAAITVIINLAANRSLRANLFVTSDATSDSRGPRIKRYLKAAEDALFVSFPPEGSMLPYAQFLEPDESGRFRYIQTGKQLLMRLT